MVLSIMSTFPFQHKHFCLPFYRSSLQLYLYPVSLYLDKSILLPIH